MLHLSWLLPDSAHSLHRTVLTYGTTPPFMLYGLLLPSCFMGFFNRIKTATVNCRWLIGS